jgi:hypothetical protein
VQHHYWLQLLLSQGRLNVKFGTAQGVKAAQPGGLVPTMLAGSQGVFLIGTNHHCSTPEEPPAAGGCAFLCRLLRCGQSCQECCDCCCDGAGCPCDCCRLPGKDQIGCKLLLQLQPAGPTPSRGGLSITGDTQRHGDRDQQQKPSRCSVG